MGRAAIRSIFLSCLRGSEQDHARREAELLFLSCLRGSERAQHRQRA
mgnify:CR=1 FL=1